MENVPNTKTYPNQKTIIVRHAVHDKNHLYAALSVDAIDKAMTALSGNAFKLWAYIAKNQDGFNLALSSTDICDNRNLMARSTYNLCVKELIKNGYLQKMNGKKTIFYFYENLDDDYVTVPDLEDIKQMKPIETRLNDSDFLIDIANMAHDDILTDYQEPQKEDIAECNDEFELPFECV